MSKLFIQCVYIPENTFVLVGASLTVAAMGFSGLSWHTSDDTLREGFQPFGEIQEAVSLP